MRYIPHPKNSSKYFPLVMKYRFLINDIYVVRKEVLGVKIPPRRQKNKVNNQCREKEALLIFSAGYSLTNNVGRYSIIRPLFGKTP